MSQADLCPPVHSIAGFADPVSSMTHLLGALSFGVLSVFLLRQAHGHRGRQAALGIFAFAVVLMFSMSGVFHLLPHHTAGRSVLQRLDHASIFVLIAASLTAPHAILFRGWLRWGVIGLVWALAATIIPLRVVFFEQTTELLGLLLYLGMGWIGLFSGIVVWRLYGPRLMAPLLLGGVAYTAGALLDFLRWPNPIPGVVHAHELFHLFVIAGVAFHWWFCACFAGGRPARVLDRGRARVALYLEDAATTGQLGDAIDQDDQAAQLARRLVGRLIALSAEGERDPDATPG